MRPVKKGSTDQSVVIRIIDSSDGTPETGVDYDTAGIDLWYRREGATKTSITEAALASLDAAHSDGGIEHIGDGYYRLDLPDAAVAASADGVMVGGNVTDVIVIGVYVPLVDYDPYDSVRMGMTALPNAAADAAGGLPISDAGGLDLDAQIGTDIDNLVTRLGTPGDLGSGATVAANLADIESQTDDIGAAGAGLTAIPWNAAWDAEVQSEVLDALKGAGACGDGDTLAAGSVGETLRWLRHFAKNEWRIDESANPDTFKIYKDDNTTESYGFTVYTSSSINYRDPA